MYRDPLASPLGREFPPPCIMDILYSSIFLCSHYPMLKGVRFLGVSQNLAVSQTGYLTRKEVIKTSRHIIKVCESVIKERCNLLYYWLCHTILQQDSR